MMNKFDQKVASLTPSELSRLALARRGKAKLTIPPREPRAVEPTSSAQRRLWFVDQLAPNSSQYHVPIVLQFAGSLDATSLHTALARLTERHEILRTTFAEIDGVPFQAVHKSVEPALRSEER